MDIVTLRICCACCNLFSDCVARRLLKSRLWCKLLIQIVKIAQHTLLDFNFYVDPAVAWNFGRDVAAIGGHLFAVYQFLFHAAPDNFQKDLSEQAALIPLVDSCFAKCRMIPYLFSTLKVPKPTISNVQLNFLDKLAFWVDTVKVSHQQHFKHTDRVNRWTAICRVIWRYKIVDKVKLNHLIDFPK